MTPSSSCPPEPVLREYAAGQLEAAVAQGVRDHLGQCEACRTRAERFRVNAVQDSTVPSGPPGEPPTVDGDRALETPTEEEDYFDDITFLLPSTNPDAIGRIGNYDVLSFLGRGGMGVVLKAFDPSLHRTVAIKVLSPQLATNRKAHKRFLREARAAAGINHPNVVTIHAVEVQAGMPYLVMEYVPGRSLRERIRTQRRFDLLSLLRIGSQIAAGLAAAHQQGVIHRDIKPANIMLEDGIERVKITDFGLAHVALDATQITSAERVVGTPAYMSPEQVRGERVDPRSDLFGLGCVLYALVAGHSPFHGSHALEVARKVTDLQPRPLHELNPEVPTYLSDVVMRLLEKDSANRFQSADEVRDLLQRYLALASQGEVPAPLRPLRPRARFRRGTIVAVVAGAALIALLAADMLLLAPAKHSSFLTTDPPPPPAPVAGALLRVSQRGDADCRSIAEALARVGPGSTIRVIDDSVYTERIAIHGAARLQGLTLEATAGAVVAGKEGPPAGPYAVVLVEETPGVTVRGFRVQAGFNQHGLMAKGPVPGLTVEDVTFQQPLDSEWANVYIGDDASATAAAPVRLCRCSIETAKFGLMLGHQERAGMTNVLVEECRFTGKGSHLKIMLPAHDITVRGNLFLGGSKGIELHPIFVDCPTRNLKLHNNSFFDTFCWFSLSNRTAPNQVCVANNLILGAVSVDIRGHAVDEMARSWCFGHNLWEPAANADREAERVATLGLVDGLLSREPGHADFLRPGPDAVAGRAGAGGDLPGYVGALPPRNP